MKQVILALISLCFFGPFAETCDSTTISEANIDCYKRFEKEHGGLPRKPNDPIEPTGNIRLLCCMLKYNKYCVPKLLEDKGCHPAAALQSATEIETRMKNCPTTNPICVPPPQCKRGLPDAKLICEYRYKKEHGTTAPKRRADLQARDQGRNKVYKKRCWLFDERPLFAQNTGFSEKGFTVVSVTEMQKVWVRVLQLAKLFSDFHPSRFMPDKLAENMASFSVKLVFTEMVIRTPSLLA
ncbi:uncharacterized protein LOC135376599 [Ornithodoros turicata]|uniref:uncharacterized protein LOC135376599 n=1 Tax=Ornithodoros turicata TaxID=34597 RepID=UPI0031388EB3